MESPQETKRSICQPTQCLQSATAGIGTFNSITYDYNAVGLVSYLAVSGENAFSYSCNGRNHLSSITNPNSLQASPTCRLPSASSPHPRRRR